MEDVVQEALRKGVELHKAGQFDLAKELYASVIQLEPRHPDANHNISVIEMDTGNISAAVPRLKIALEETPENAQYWISYIDALIRHEAIDEARNTLALAKQKGAEGEAFDQLDQRINEFEGALLEAKSDDSGELLTKTNILDTLKLDKALKLAKQKSKEGSSEEARQIYKDILDRFPKNKKAIEGIKALERNVSARLQDPPQDHLQTLINLYSQGNLQHVLAQAKQLLKQFPYSATLHNICGVVREGLGQFDAARENYELAIKIKPDYAEVHYNLGNVLKRTGDLKEATDSYMSAIKFKPDYADAYYNMGTALQEQGDLEAAIVSYEKAIIIRPDYPECYFNMGNAQQQMGDLEAATDSYKQAIEIKPDYVEVYYNLGNILQERGNLRSSIENYKKAIDIKPDFVEAYTNLGSAFKKKGNLEVAIENFRKAIKIKPDYARAYSNMGSALKDNGELEAAIESYKQALKFEPDYVDAYSNMLFCKLLNPEETPKTIFQAHCAFAEYFENPFLPFWRKHTNTREPNRVLNIGFVSADFRNHVVASYFEPIIEQLSSSSNSTFHAYHNFAIEDNRTRAIKKYFTHWTPVKNITDDQLAEKISQDNIDILIDLSGHTGGNRLLVFARKPAPIQVTALGYEATTGLKSIDYYIADNYTLPSGQFDDQYSEKIVSLASEYPYSRFIHFPPVSELPALTNNYITFGSFFKSGKINRAVISLWSNLLNAVPKSRIIIGGMEEKTSAKRFVNWFRQENVDLDRVEFRQKTDFETFCKYHNDIDICLAPFPFPGATTIKCAIGMGVPTLVLSGDIIPNRRTGHILHFAGLPELVCNNEAEFLEKGIELSNDFEKLSNIRSAAKNYRIDASIKSREFPLLFDSALRIMWKRWCEGLEPVAFEVKV
jgi:protein O-GlcNAc transferase